MATPSAPSSSDQRRKQTSSAATRFPRLKRALRVIEHGLAIAGLFFIVYHVGFDLSVMTSGSMSPTLRGTSARDGEWVLTERVSYWLRQPRRWEVLTFRKDDGMQVMKRVVGLPGEKVLMDGSGQVFIGGGAVERPASLASLKYYAFGNLFRGAQVECGRGYYVLGDDSRDSQDSRFEGPVMPREVIGRAWLVVWPMGKVRFVNP